MASEIVTEELSNFLNSHEPGVFVVKGKWGVGKTYLVQKIFADNRNGWGKKKRAYVSLFGLNSLTELREHIFIEIESSMRNTRQAKKAFGGLGKLLSGSGEFKGTIGGGLINLSTQVLMNLAIPGSKIIVDDVERRGDDLSIKDLLGFLSQLKEQNQCQIVLIFNDGELEESAMKEIERYREKVFDREIVFEPNVEEVIRLGFPDAPPFTAELLKHISVDNIRAVQKLKEFTERLQPHMKGANEEANRTVVESAVILGWFYFSREKTSIPWEFVKEYSGEFFISRYLDSEYSNNKPETEEQRVRQLYALRLQELKYQPTGPLEKLLVSALETGLNRPEELNAILEELNRKAELSKAQRFLTNEVWSIYHSSFEDDERKFTDAMVACFKQRSADLNIQSLNEAVSIMEELENNDVADELWRIYFEARPKLDPEYEWSQLPRYSNSSRVKKRLVHDHRD